MTRALTKRVLLIGWDAADWPLLRPLLDAGKMPNLLRLIEEGTSGQISTLRPILSPMLWNSIATGKRGDKHGILGFVEPTPDGKGVRPVTSHSRKVKALWNLLSQHDRRSVVVNWFASHPAEPVAGAIVSNRYSEAALHTAPVDESAFHPRDLTEVMEKLRLQASTLTPAQMLPFFLEKLPVDDDPRLQALARVYAQCASVHNAATYLAEAEEWDFLAVYYDMIDHVGHGFAQFEPPQMRHVSDEDFKVFRHVMESTYRYHDLMLGRWMELAGEDCIIILLSDHGFYHGEARPLANRGHLSGEREPGVTQDPLAWHRPNGIFVAHGPGIKKDQLIHGASLLDVAPTILALLGLPVPRDMDGSVLEQVTQSPLKIDYIASLEEPHPRDGVHRDAPIEEKDPWAAQQTLQQLAELGYIDAPDGDAAKLVAKCVEERESHLAQVYFSTARFEEALSILTRLTAQQATNPSYSCRQVMCLLAINRVDEAAEIIAEVVKSAPHYALGQLLFAQVELMKGNVESANAILSRVKEAEAHMPLVHLEVAMTSIRQGQWEAAADTCRRILEIDPDSAGAHDSLGVALRHLGRYEDAVYEHMRAASLQHDRAQTHVNLGLSLIRTQQINWAIRAFGVAAELAPNEPYPHRCLARIYRRILPDRDKARHHLLRARELRRKLGRTVPSFRHGV
jgi:predicted AlkP superfamily phosphohydrolase/phosphomutase/Flp pilus assembly protein TadD